MSTAKETERERERQREREREGGRERERENRTTGTVSPKKRVLSDLLRTFAQSISKSFYFRLGGHRYYFYFSAVSKRTFKETGDPGASFAYRQICPAKIQLRNCDVRETWVSRPAKGHQRSSSPTSALGQFRLRRSHGPIVVRGLYHPPRAHKSFLQRSLDVRRFERVGWVATGRLGTMQEFMKLTGHLHGRIQVTM